jgi:hypothetical protein
MPWRIEDVLSDRGANYVQGGLFKAFAVRDGRLITGQQQYSGRRVAQMVIEALGVCPGCVRRRRARSRLTKRPRRLPSSSGIAPWPDPRQP